GSSGWNSMDVIQVSSLNIAPGIATQNQSTTPFAGTSNSGPSIIMSGFASHPPTGHCLGAGASLDSPSAAPPSTHATNLSISPCERERSFEKCPTFGSANQGGIFLVATAFLIAFAQGRTS